jgi:hypothetical protein
MSGTDDPAQLPPSIQQAAKALAEAIYRDLSAAEGVILHDEVWGPRFYVLASQCGAAQSALQRGEIAEAMVRLIVGLREVRAALIGKLGEDD